VLMPVASCLLPECAMLSYLIRRLLSTIVVMTVVAVFVFLLLHLSPGDPAAIIAGDNATAEQIASIRKKLGLEDALLLQFWRWAASVVQGDLGVSIYSSIPVTTLISQRLEPTLSLALTTITLAVVLALLAGVTAAARVGSLFDRGVMTFAVLGFSMPAFVVGYSLVYIFSMQLRWLPVQGYKPFADGTWEWFRHLILPSITLGMAYVALIARITRASMLEVLSEDYMRTARAKGVGNSSRLLKHALKNAAVPIVVITETVFNLPGVGRLTVDAITRRDYPIIQGVILVFSGVYVLINLAVDLSYALFDPRIKY
jgi:peptide/nickel transport system permease protein